MSPKLNTLILALTVLINIVKGQNSNLEYGIDHAFKLNILDSSLVTGFYLLTPYYEYEIQATYRAEYNQHVDEIIINKPFRLKSQGSKYNFIHSTSKIVDATNPMADKFIRRIDSTGNLFLVNPLPISAKENIIRAYRFSNFSYDSSIFYCGLTFKLNYCADSLLCANMFADNRNCQIVGLIINNQLLAISRMYIKNENEEKYLSFTWKGNLPEEAEKLYKSMYQISLIPCNEK